MTIRQRIAVIGGTGAEGGGIALRLAQAGYEVTIGSRSNEKAVEAADELTAILGGSARITGADNVTAADGADIVFLTVPYAAQRPTVDSIAAELRGKILVDATAPLMPPKVARVQLPEGGSAVTAIQEALGDDVRVVSALQNVAAEKLRDLEHEVPCDVLVCGDDGDARREVIALLAAARIRGIEAGPIANSAAAEALTSVIIAINRAHKVTGAGIRIVGI
ncbi:MAG: NADPH-dependent F420 reductase [Hyphomicrobiales bacterium]|nr:MAG: NADPH-dependent F420 reductase [Hyphomicrobiales bacterium]